MRNFWKTIMAISLMKTHSAIIISQCTPTQSWRTRIRLLTFWTFALWNLCFSELLAFRTFEFLSFWTLELWAWIAEGSSFRTFKWSSFWFMNSWSSELLNIWTFCLLSLRTLNLFLFELLNCLLIRTFRFSNLYTFEITRLRTCFLNFWVSFSF